MAVWPFNRKQKNTSEVPPEVKQYYESEHRERVGLAWLVAFLSLIATVLIVAGLFFGGRWIYRKVSNDNPPANVQTSESDKSESSNSNDQAESNNQSQSESNNDESSNSSNPESESGSNQNESSNNSTDTDQSITGTTDQAAPDQMADTGPGSTLAVFVAVSVVAMLGHSAYLRRKQVNR